MVLNFAAILKAAYHSLPCQVFVNKHGEWPEEGLKLEDFFV